MLTVLSPAVPTSVPRRSGAGFVGASTVTVAIFCLARASNFIYKKDFTSLFYISEFQLHIPSIKVNIPQIPLDLFCHSINLFFIISLERFVFSHDPEAIPASPDIRDLPPHDYMRELQSNSVCSFKNSLLTLNEVDEHFEVPYLGLQLFQQLLLHPGWIHNLCYGSIHPLPQFLWRECCKIFTQVHVEFLYQLIYNHLQNTSEHCDFTMWHCCPRSSSIPFPEVQKQDTFAAQK